MEIQKRLTKQQKIKKVQQVYNNMIKGANKHSKKECNCESKKECMIKQFEYSMRAGGIFNACLLLGINLKIPKEKHTIEFDDEEGRFVEWKI